MSVMNGGGNNFVAFGVETFDICRCSTDKFCRAFRDASQDLFRVRTERQSFKEIPKSALLPPTFLDAPHPNANSCGGHQITQPRPHLRNPCFNSRSIA